MLTEAFEYARALTIRDTALYTASPQHPSFAMQLRGRHDLALSTLAGANAVIAVDQQDGPLELVHLGSGVVVLELPQGPRSLRLAVTPGRYVLRRRRESRVWASEIELKSGQTVAVDEAHLTLVGSQALATKGAAPRPLTLTTVPKGMQEITSWLGVDHGAKPGLVLPTDDNFQFGMIAPRGLTDRLQWLLPSLAFAYRGGEHGGLEWIPRGGLVGWGIGYDTINGLLLQARLGLGFDLRYWVSPRSSLDLGFGLSSGLRWTQNHPDGLVATPRAVDASSSLTQPETPRWIPPTTWRSALSLGYTYTLSEVVTFHIAVAVAQNHLTSGDFVSPTWLGEDAALAIGVGGVQSIGLRSLPVVRIHVRDWFAINLDAAVHIVPSRHAIVETYLAGASFIW